MALDGRQRQMLRAKAQQLKSRITVGKDGPTDPVVAEIRRALETAELVKVRITHPEREEIDRIAEQIAAAVPCVLVGRVGFVATFFKAAEPPAE